MFVVGSKTISGWYITIGRNDHFSAGLSPKNPNRSSVSSCSSSPNSPTFFQNLLRCLVPESQSTVTTLLPSGNFMAAATAATQLTELLLPTNMPSCSTSHLAILHACSSETFTASVM